MAAIEQPTPKTGKKPRARKHSFHLDMTPMVDLAFLLLTFFMLTTTFAKARVMQLTMPVPDKDHVTEVASHNAMTIVLGREHQVHYYLGLYASADPSVSVPTLHTTSFGPQGIRQVLLTFRQQEPEGFILIKAGVQATYQDMVDILDEMSIVSQKKYVLVTATVNDAQLLQKAGY